MSQGKTSKQTSGADLKGAAKHLFNEVEKAGESIINDIKQGLETITDRVVSTAKTTVGDIADTTHSVVDKVTNMDVPQPFKYCRVYRRNRRRSLRRDSK